MKKAFKWILIIGLAVIAASFAAICIYYTHCYNQVEKEALKYQELKSLPEHYTDKCTEKGKVEEIEYETSFEGESEVKKANVYLPYGYSEDEKYEVLYLMHGRGGKYLSWLGKGGKRPFKNVLDNMIKNGDIRPIIVVTPGLAYEYGDDDDVMDGTANEITADLIPVVNDEYSTYGDRNHTCMAGFSMGGSLTWHMVKDHMDCFRYYIPMSMALYYDEDGYSKGKSLRASIGMSRSIRKSGYTADDFRIFCATGLLDYKSLAACMQVADLLTSKDIFEYANDDFTKGNIKFNVWPYGWHRYTQAFPYLYNGLGYFFGTDRK